MIPEKIEALVAVRHLDEWKLTDSEQALLTDAENQRLKEFSVDSRRFEYMAAHILARICLDKIIPGSINQWRLCASGPVLVDGPCEAWVSLSHSNGWIAAAVSLVGKIGLDIECQKENKNWYGIAHRYFPSSELVWLKQLDGLNGKKSFYELWTMKEAYLKALMLNFHDGYKLIEQRGKNLQPVHAATGQSIIGWRIVRGWYSNIVSLCVFAHNTSSIYFLDSELALHEIDDILNFT